MRRSATLLVSAELLLDQVGAVVQGHHRESFSLLGADLTARLGAEGMAACRERARALSADEVAAFAVERR